MIWDGALDMTPSRRMMSSAASPSAAAAGEAGDDDVKDGNDARNDGLKD